MNNIHFILSFVYSLGNYFENRGKFGYFNDTVATGECAGGTDTIPPA